MNANLRFALKYVNENSLIKLTNKLINVIQLWFVCSCVCVCVQMEDFAIIVVSHLKFTTLASH